MRRQKTKAVRCVFFVVSALCLWPFAFSAPARSGIVSEVRSAIARHDFQLAESHIQKYRSEHGITPEMIEALSWLGRGALASKELEKAEQYAQQTQKLVLEQLKKRGLDAEPSLPLALGAAIEVQSQVMAARGEGGEAVAFLQKELAAYGNTSIRTRIQKNINLLSLEGKPPPPLSGYPPLAQWKGHPVLLFFWAHWCPDCKSEVPVLARLMDEYGNRGLVLIGPTQRYGYTARGEAASPEQELRYIEEVRKKYYAPLSEMAAPVSEENFKTYGASTVPTLVLIDRQGIVRMYHPGKMSYEELSAQIDVQPGREQ
jgi:thiol-disulfide isomerase/thioredoxin